MGEIVSVLNALALIDGRRAAGGDTFGAGALLSTNASGRATFALKRKFRDCQMQFDSAVQVLPSPNMMLDFQKGTAICSTTTDNENVELGAGGTKIELRDPVFSVTAQPGQVGVRVYRGFVQVQSGQAGQGVARLVGPGAQTMVPRGGAARRSEALRVASANESGSEAQVAARMQRALPQPTFGFPSSDDSPTLRRVGQEKELRVAVSDIASKASRDFVASYFGFLKQQWDLDAVETPSMSSREATTALASGDVDAVVSPTPIQDAESIPFYGDEGERRWFLHVSGADPTYRAALTQFLVRTLDIGIYGSRYLAAFNQVPTYEAVRPLVFP